MRVPLPLQVRDTRCLFAAMVVVEVDIDRPTRQAHPTHDPSADILRISVSVAATATGRLAVMAPGLFSTKMGHGRP
jgi:hypothetical protein